MKVERYPLTPHGQMLWADFVEAAQQRLGVDEWMIPFIDQTATIPSALKNAERTGVVPRKLFLHLSSIKPVSWCPPDRDADFSRLLRMARDQGVDLCKQQDAI